MSNENTVASQLQTQQGDTITMYFYWYGGANGEPSRVPDGYIILFGWYDKSGVLLHSAEFDDTDYLPQHACYKIRVGHQESIKFVGKVKTEITISKDNDENVDHSSRIVTLKSDKRQNNELI